MYYGIIHFIMPTTVQSLIDRDRTVNWHPYTQMKELETQPPLPIAASKGIYVTDTDGNHYIDTISSWWCNIHGHNHPHITSALMHQANQFSHVMFAGITHEPAVTLSERLVALTPDSLTRVFYSDNGSSAVETALKQSVQYWKQSGYHRKQRFISLEHSYHGDTVGCMAVSDASEFHGAFSSLVVPAFKIPVPTPKRKPANLNMTGFMRYCENALTNYLKIHNSEIAAIIVEPLVQAAGGFIFYPSEFLETLQSIASQYKVHLIVDEVATGFGRTGRLFASDYTSIEPDFMCLSKGLTSGTLPFAATLTTDRIYQAFYDDYSAGKTFFHGHTYCANPLGCAVALATLDVFESENTLNHVQSLEPLLATEIDQLTTIPGVNHHRSIGLIGAVDVAPLQSGDRLSPVIHQRGLDAGLFIRPLGNTVYVMPPLCITRAELQTVMDTLASILKDLDLVV